MTMRLRIRQTTAQGARRIFAGIGVLVVFGVLFAMPLCVALTLCTMPCCHHESATGSVVSGAMAACETECGIRSADATPATVAAVAPQTGRPRISPLPALVVQVPDDSAVPPTLENDARSSHRVAAAPLHVLNSTFRI